MTSTLKEALTHKFLPYQEYHLQGSITDNAKDVLLQRLRGLCDCTESEPETFCDHEIVYSIRSRPPGMGAPSTLSARAVHALDHPDEPWHLRYIGNPEVSGAERSKSVMVRTCIDVATSENLTQFLEQLGFEFEYEFVSKGYMFRKGRMKITVSKILKMPLKGNTDELEALSQSHLVELSLVTPAGQDAVADDMRTFADQLKPLLQLEKIDTRRLQ